MTKHGAGPDPIMTSEEEPKQFTDSRSISALWLAVVALERQVRELTTKVECLEKFPRQSQESVLFRHALYRNCKTR